MHFGDVVLRCGRPSRQWLSQNNSEIFFRDQFNILNLQIFLRRLPDLPSKRRSNATTTGIIRKKLQGLRRVYPVL